MKGRSKGAREITFGDYGLQAVEPAWMTSRQIEAVRVILSRHMKKTGRMFLRVFPDKPVSKKPAETASIAIERKGKKFDVIWRLAFIALAALGRAKRLDCSIDGAQGCGNTSPCDAA